MPGEFGLTTAERTAEENRPWTERSGENGVLDLLLILASRRRLIACFTIVGGSLGALALFLIPPVYTASAVIMPPQQQQSTASILLGQLGAVAGGSRSELLKTPSDMYIGILKSRTIADNLVARFDLKQLYRAATMVEARDALEGRVRFQTGKDSLIRILVDDRDPKRAADLANAYVEELHKQNSRLALTESAQRRLFFERQMENEKATLARVEQDLRRLQRRTGMLQVSSQTEATIRAIAQVQAEIAGRQVLLERLKAGATAENPEVIRIEAELKGLGTVLHRLESSGPQYRPGSLVIPASEIPAASLEYVRAVRELKYHETLFEFLAKQYEMARVDEAKQASVIQVVDRAVPPDRKSGPPRTILALLAALSSAILGSVVAVMERGLSNPVKAGKLRTLKQALFAVGGR